MASPLLSLNSHVNYVIKLSHNTKTTSFCIKKLGSEKIRAEEGERGVRGGCTVPGEERDGG